MADPYLDEVAMYMTPGPAMSVAPPPAPMMSVAPPPEAMAPMGPPPPPVAPLAPNTAASSLASAARSAVPFGPPAPPPAPPAEAEEPARNPDALGFNLRRVGSGYATLPAHEMDLRGPSLKAAQSHVNENTGETIGRVADRNAGAAAHEYGVYLGMERQAQSRQLAAEQAAAERDEELYQRQMDFDQSVKALSQASMDPDRFWSSRSTGQKVAGMVGVALGGFLQGARGGPNPALEMINTAIERDIKAQEFGYMAARDTASQKQTAFAMAMQKFHSVDAARSLARAAALDAVQAQLGQAKAVYAGTEAANRADMAMAQIEVDKMNQIAQGVRFIPQQQVAVGAWVDPETGLTYNDAQAREVAAKLRDNRQAKQMEGLKTAGKVIENASQAQVTGAKDMAQKIVPPMEVGGVKLPAYSALTVDEAKEDRVARKAGADLVGMIDKALSIRERQGVTGRLGSKLSPVNMTWENEIESLGPQMGVAWSKTKKLGTYDAGVERLITGMQGDLKALGSAPEDKLRAIRAEVMKGLQTTKEAQTGESRSAATFSEGSTATTLKTYGGK